MLPLFVSGCRNRCKNCFNAVTWDFLYGKPFDQAVEDDIIASTRPRWISGLSLLGGEPFEPENQRALVPFLHEVRVLYPHKTIWCYTGNNLEHEVWQPGCGRCHQPLLDGRPVALDDLNLDAVLRHSDRPVIVDFWAAWCGPCRQMAPQFQAAAAQLQGRALFAKVDSDACPEASARHAIRSIPTLALFVGGREIARQPGAMGGADIVRWTQQALGRAAAA